MVSTEDLRIAAEKENARLKAFLGTLAAFHASLRGGYLTAGHRAEASKDDIEGRFVPKWPELKVAATQIKPAAGDREPILRVLWDNIVTGDMGRYSEAEEHTADNPFMGDWLDWRLCVSHSGPNLQVVTTADKDGRRRLAPIFLDFTRVEVIPVEVQAPVS